MLICSIGPLPAPRARPAPASDCLGDAAVVGDLRWTGSFGIDADAACREHSCLITVRTADIEVARARPCPRARARERARACLV